MFCSSPPSALYIVNPFTLSYQSNAKDVHLFLWAFFVFLCSACLSLLTIPKPIFSLLRKGMQVREPLHYDQSSESCGWSPSFCLFGCTWFHITELRRLYWSWPLLLHSAYKRVCAPIREYVKMCSRWAAAIAQDPLWVFFSAVS